MKLIGFWPPYFFSGISVEKVNDDFTSITTKMKQYWFNTNYVGTHFGGSLYSMCDPFYMFILLHHLGKDHIVWDKTSYIDFIKPGKRIVRSTFSVSLDEIEKLRKKALEEFSFNAEFQTDIRDESGEVVAKVKKLLYIRRKDAKKRIKKGP